MKTCGQRTPSPSSWWRVALLCLVGATSLPAFSTASAQAASGTIAGRVTDERSGVPVVGSVITVNGTRLGATTDGDGRYRIQGVAPGTQLLVARRIGYVADSLSVNVSANQEVRADFKLLSAAFSLEQIVVTGTPGGEQRRSLGNAVGTIDVTTALEKSAAPNLTSILSSRANGAIITPGSGRLGAGPTIQIRGRSSLSLSSEPIIYVDGVRVNNAVNQGPTGAAGAFGAQNSQVSSRLNDINPDDIASIEIIRGPAAATIYGTEAANGVIQIITKKGAGGAARWTASVGQGIQSFRDPEGRIPTNYFRNGAGEVVGWNGYQQEADSGRAYFHTGNTQSYNLGVSGGLTDQFTYYVSGTYDREKGIEPNNFGRSFSGRANLAFTPSDKLDIQSNMGYVRSSTHLGVDAGLGTMYNTLYGHPLAFGTATRGFALTPPEVTQRLFDNSSDINRFTGGITANHRPSDWFTQRLTVGIDFTADDSRALERFAPPDLAPYLVGLGATRGRIYQNLRNNSYITGDYAATGKIDVGAGISSSSSVGVNFIKKYLNTSGLGAVGFPAPGLETVSSATDPPSVSQSQIINTTLGVWGQQQFGWNDRRFITAALRVDNNSAFGNDFQWVSYPKLSASWVLSEEPFWGDLSQTVNSLKLRTAYGQSGQQPDAFAALRTFVAAGRGNGAAGVTPGSFGNDALRPERGTEFEVGFETEILHRLSFDFTYFNKRTRDAILLQPTAPSGGFPGSRPVNIGETKNHGMEMQANLQVLARENVAWELTGQVATNKDEVVSLGDLPFAGTTFRRSVVGYPIGGMWSKRVVSADRDPVTSAISNVLCDGGPGNAPVACGAAPEVFIGTPTPKVTGAVSSTVTLFDRLSVYGLLDIKRGHKLLNANETNRCGALLPLCDANYNPAGYETNYLASLSRLSGGPAVIQGAFMQDASFVRLAEVSVTYQLPSRFVSGIGASGGRLSVAGRNLHLWTDYGGLDPESRYGANGIDQAIIPPLQRFVATLNLTF